METKNRAPEFLILLELEKLIRLFSFYPAGHQYLNVASQRILNAIKQQFGALKSVIYTIDRRHVFLNDNPLDGFDKLARLLFYKRIKTLIIYNTVKPEELLKFVSEVSYGDLVLPKEKSIKEILFKNGIAGIDVEELDYDTIREAIEDDMDQQADTAEEEIKLENVVQDLTNDEQEAIRLITLIENESNPKKYDELSNTLTVIIARLIEIKRYEIPLIATRMYTNHVYLKNKDKNIAEKAKAMVETISFETEMLNKILEPIITGNPYYYSSSLNTVRIIGDKALQQLAQTMIKTDSLQSIKFIANALSTFHKQAYDYLKNVILSNNYKASMVAIDTVFQIKAGAEPIISFGLTHNDIRVRKKALQSLFELNTSHGNKLIEQLINSKDQRTIAITIDLIGKYKRQVFIPEIKKVLLDPSLPYHIKQDAILVLGELGSKEATDLIVEHVIESNASLTNQHPEIKLVGIKALGIAMNEVAIANLVKLLESKEEDTRTAAWNTLNEIGKKLNA